MEDPRISSGLSFEAKKDVPKSPHGTNKDVQEAGYQRRLTSDFRSDTELKTFQLAAIRWLPGLSVQQPITANEWKNLIFIPTDNLGCIDRAGFVADGNHFAEAPN